MIDQTLRAAILAAILMVANVVGAQTGTARQSEAAVDVRSVPPTDVDPVFSRSLTPSFRVLNGKLAMYLVMGVKPKSVGERLYLVSGDKLEFVSSIRQLKGRVAVDDAGAALSFARLFTSHSMNFILCPPFTIETEIVSPERMNADLTLGDEALAYIMKRSGARCYGIVTAKELRKMGFRYASVRKQDGKYYVRRTLLVEQFSHSEFSLNDVEECVTEDGGYARRIVRTKRLGKSAALVWSRPRDR